MIGLIFLYFALSAAGLCPIASLYDFYFFGSTAQQYLSNPQQMSSEFANKDCGPSIGDSVHLKDLAFNGLCNFVFIYFILVG